MPVSREMSILASLAAILIAFVFVVPPRAEAFVSALMLFLDDPAGWRLERSNDVLALAGIVGLAAMEFLAPIVVLLMIAGVVASAAQNPPRYRARPDHARPGAHFDGRRVRARFRAARLDRILQEL